MEASAIDAPWQTFNISLCMHTATHPAAIHTHTLGCTALCCLQSMRPQHHQTCRTKMSPTKDVAVLGRMCHINVHSMLHVWQISVHLGLTVSPDWKSCLLLAFFGSACCTGNADGFIMCRLSVPAICCIRHRMTILDSAAVPAKGPFLPQPQRHPAAFLERHDKPSSSVRASFQPVVYELGGGMHIVHGGFLHVPMHSLSFCIETGAGADM
jgi:hypothetical protein